MTKKYENRDHGLENRTDADASVNVSNLNRRIRVGTTQAHIASLGKYRDST
jgi:hypothetical protein